MHNITHTKLTKIVIIIIIIVTLIVTGQYTI